MFARAHRFHDREKLPSKCFAGPSCTLCRALQRQSARRGSSSEEPTDAESVARTTMKKESASRTASKKGKQKPPRPPSEPTPEQRYRMLVRQLQTRELTPEDYDLLLTLDEFVAKKNVLSAEAARGALVERPAEAGEECAMCLETFEESATTAALPCCSRPFHRTCLTAWLTEGKSSCPWCQCSVCEP